MKVFTYFFSLLKYGIRRINDPYQNEVNIDYVKIDWIWQPLEIVDDKGQKVTFDYVTDNNQLNTTIHFPDGGSAQVNQELVQSVNSRKHYKLNEIIDQEGNSYKFDYYDHETKKAEGSHNGRAIDEYEEPYFLLKNIEYPTGASTIYEYEKGKRNNPIDLPWEKMRIMGIFNRMRNTLK